MIVRCGETNWGSHICWVIGDLLLGWNSWWLQKYIVIEMFCRSPVLILNGRRLPDKENSWQWKKVVQRTNTKSRISWYVHGLKPLIYPNALITGIIVDYPYNFGINQYDGATLEIAVKKNLKYMKHVCFSWTSPFCRWMIARQSCSKLFVGGLSYDTNETVLKEAFEQHGELIEVKVICDHKSGKSKGYGFVQFSSETAAGKALKDMDGKVNCKDEIYIQGESSTSINIKSIHVKVYLIF